MLWKHTVDHVGTNLTDELSHSIPDSARAHFSVALTPSSTIQFAGIFTEKAEEDFR